jgi:hypothetical protein
VLDEGVAGAARFAAGAGRHGEAMGAGEDVGDRNRNGDGDGDGEGEGADPITPEP